VKGTAVTYQLEVVILPVSDIDRSLASYASFADFTDPDGHVWVLQERN
jgi:hypothetical protein